MRIVLIYPPPWKIHHRGEKPYPPGEGPPVSGGSNAMADGDFLQAPYGMLSIAAEAKKRGYLVSTLNLANCRWSALQQSIRDKPAELYGLSCVTANRRGVSLLSDFIRKTHPSAHITVGGPHVTALPRKFLEKCPAVDTLVLGEGEAAFIDIAQRRAAGEATGGIAGTAWRDGPEIVVEPARPPIKDLDTLTSPLEFYNLRTLISSRGCPGQCTFCGSNLMWGRRTRFHSVDYLLDMLSWAVRRYDQKFIALKDDAFTLDRKRVLSLCEGIQRRRLNFLWSCETRADQLDTQMLREMRRAGCRRISIGVESASESILKNIRKRITPATVLSATRKAKRFGISIRYYLMVGNRGETYATFEESLDFLRIAKPNQFIFTQLHLYPGTEEFEHFCNEGILTPDIFFTNDGMYLTCFAGRREDALRIAKRLENLTGLQNAWEYDTAAYKRILQRLPDLHTAHMDLCCAYLKEDKMNEAESHLALALQKGYFIPGLVFNVRACLAAGRGDIAACEAYLEKAVDCYPHQVVIDNLQRLSDWQVKDGLAGKTPLMEPGGDFETTCIRHHPEFPDPDPASAAAF